MTVSVVETTPIVTGTALAAAHSRWSA
jgi:hypothetical protein